MMNFIITKDKGIFEYSYEYTRLYHQGDVTDTHYTSTCDRSQIQGKSSQVKGQAVLENENSVRSHLVEWLILQSLLLITDLVDLYKVLRCSIR